MFDITKFIAQQSRRVEIKKPDGSPIKNAQGESPWVEIYPKGSAQYAKAITKAHQRAKEANSKRGTDATEALQANGTQLLADCIGESNFAHPDGSPLRGAEAWCHTLADPTMVIIREQLDAAIGEASLPDSVDFLS